MLRRQQDQLYSTSLLGELAECSQAGHPIEEESREHQQQSERERKQVS